MAIKSYKPYTPSRRFMTGLDSSDITAKASVPSLLMKIAPMKFFCFTSSNLR